MAVNNGLISYPVGVGEVCKVLRTNHADVGWVCSRGTLINKWAKYKPVTLPNVLDTTYDLKGGTGTDKYEWKSNATWYKGHDGQCGFEIASVPFDETLDSQKSAQVLASDYTKLVNWCANGWNYVFYPKGGMSSPFRLIDFNYYDKNAVPFIKSVTLPDKDTFCAGDNEAYAMTWTLVLPTATESQYSLSFVDVSRSNTPLSNFHMGLIFVNVGHAFESTSPLLYRKFVVINEYPLSNTTYGRSLSVTGDMTASLVDEGNIRDRQKYEVYPFLTANINAGVGMYEWGRYSTNPIAMPNYSVKALTLTPNELDGFIQGSLTYIQYEDYRHFRGVYLSLLNTSSTKTISFTKATLDSNIKFTVYTNNGTSYTQYSQFSIGSEGAQYVRGEYDDTQVSFPVTMAPGESKIIYISMNADNSHFNLNIQQEIRVTGSIAYTWTKTGGTSGSSTATLLANPPREPQYQPAQLSWKPEIELKSKSSSSFVLNIRCENISTYSQPLNWGLLEYDVYSYPLDAQGSIDYQNGYTQTGLAMSGTTGNITPGNYTPYYGGDNGLTVSPAGIETRYGYFVMVTVHAASGWNMDRATISVEYKV